MDPRKCQTATASPAEPGELPIWLDQWAFLQSIQPPSPFLLELIIQKASGGAYPLEVAFVAEKDVREP
jgi:hypothetical protein